MTITDLLPPVEYVVDEAGHKKAVLVDFDAWEQLLVRLNALVSEIERLEEEDEKKWDETFARSADKLAILADEALAEYHQGKTGSLEPDEL